MANSNQNRVKEKTYWPHMIVGFLLLALTLSFWTVKSASSIPVQEANQYMLKYQMADMTMNEILESKKRFDQVYTIKLEDAKTMVMTDNIHAHRPQPNPVKLLQGENHLRYSIRRHDGTQVKDANVSFLLTRPHSRRDDVIIEEIGFKEGYYKIPTLKLEKAGRYTLVLKVKVGTAIGHSEIAAYVKP